MAHRTPAIDPARDLSDVDCLDRIRAGDLSAYAVLFRRHYRATVQITASSMGIAMAEEHTAEAFARILDLLRSGRGPETTFRNYLITAVQRLHIDHLRKQARMTLVDDVEQFVEGDLSFDPYDSWLDAGHVATAFRALPDRWRRALWMHTVEGRPLSEVAAAMGISLNATAQLSFRAREALRLAYLAAHVPQPDQPHCRKVVEDLPRLVRGTLTARLDQVKSHLRWCTPCADRASEMSGVAALLNR